MTAPFTSTSGLQITLYARDVYRVAPPGSPGYLWVGWALPAARRGRPARVWDARGTELDPTAGDAADAVAAVSEYWGNWTPPGSWRGNSTPGRRCTLRSSGTLPPWETSTWSGVTVWKGPAGHHHLRALFVYPGRAYSMSL